tara:strand:- start:235 stop:507 length:273 start_codon:yes stop_codon:yes gene_type:complete
LIDSRHGIKASDKELMNELDDAAVVYQIILTKADKVSVKDITEFSRGFELMRKKHPASHPEIIATSARKDKGIAELRSSLSLLVAPYHFR